MNGHTATVKALVRGRADVHTIDHNGSTALKYAKERGHLDTVEILLSAGAGVARPMMKTDQTASS
jgi:ankyrin repeat protein